MKGTAVFTTKNVMQTQVEAVWRSESEFGKKIVRGSVKSGLEC